MKLELWVYKLLLQAYPKDFRLEFGHEMLQVFRLQFEDAKLEKRILTFWFRTVKDIFLSAFRERTQKQRKSNMVIRYDFGAQLVFHLTREEADRLKHNLIEPEHVLLGLLRQHEGIRNVLEQMGGNIEYFRKRLQTPQAEGHLARSPQITKRTRFAMEQSAKEAKALGSNHVDSRHILLGLMADHEGLVYNWLRELADPNEIRKQILVA